MGLIIDYFAGGGGASTAMEQALGRTVDIAVNHDADAIAMHEANHPHTLHLQENVWAVSPAETCAGRPIDVMWFSPDCKHFSRAKGGAPVSKRVRGLAWVVLRWAALPKWQRPRVIFLENVEEFQTWGPLCKRGRPIAKDMGETFRLWVSHLEALGYRVEWRVLRACDYGAPTIRKRLFLVARCDGEPIRWPEPTHANPDLKKRGMKPWRTAADIIDWSIPCPSIFERKIPLKDKTMARIARGIMRYVVDNPQPFIVPITHTKAGNMAYPVREPVRTITTAKGGEMAVVAPTLVSVGHGFSGGRREYPIDAPALTVTAGGNHQALVAAFLAQHNDGPRNKGLTGRAADAPISTITGRGTQQQVVTSHLLKLRGTSKDGRPIDEPAPTVTAGGLHIGEVRAFLLKYYGNEADGHDLTGPLGTVTTRDRFGLVTVAGAEYVIADIGMRMLAPHELYAAQGFPPEYVIQPMIDGRPMSKSASIARCGNSVSPPVARALVEANAPMFSRVAGGSPRFAEAG